MLNRLLLLTLFISTSLLCGAQSGHYWSSQDHHRILLKNALKNDQRDHLVVKPASIRDIDSTLLAFKDSLILLREFGSDFWNSPQDGKANVGFVPLVDFSLGYSDRAKTLWSAGIGLAANFKLGNKLSLYADFIYGEENPAQYISDFIDSTGVFPTMGKNRSDAGYSYLFPTVRLTYSPVKYFQFEIGFGKHSIGQGFRSLLLSETAYNYPYLKIETDVWNIKYINLFSAQDGTNPLLGDLTAFQRKYTSSHFLSWAISPRVNIGLFESIVWQAQDTLSDRGFDPNYVNPIIFFRPVEFSLGSADNAILGLDFSYKISKKLIAYTQFVLDEFLLSELRSGSGWWGNKWGAQIGFQWFDYLDLDDSWLRAEFNVVRPFTYTHGSVLQNYAHYNQPLAHQLGANFYEGILQAYGEKGNLFAEADFMYAIYGRDPDSLNLGGNVFRSYINPAMEFDNEITQGVKNEVYLQRIAAGLILNRNLNLRASLSYTFRYSYNELLGTRNEHFFGVQLSTRLFNKYRTF